MTAASPEVTDVREERQEAKPESKPLKVCHYRLPCLCPDCLTISFSSSPQPLLSLEADEADVVLEKAESKRASKAAKKAEKAKQAEEAKAAQAAKAEAEAAKAEAEAAEAEAEAAEAEAAAAEVEAAAAEVEAAEDEAAKVGGSRVKNLTISFVRFGSVRKRRLTCQICSLIICFIYQLPFWLKIQFVITHFRLIGLLGLGDHCDPFFLSNGSLNGLSTCASSFEQPAADPAITFSSCTWSR